MTAEPRLAVYQRWLQEHRGLSFGRYDALWQWSVDDLHGFWSSIWDFFDLQSPTPWRTVLEVPVMPGAVWFPGAQLNFAQQALRHADAAHAAGHPAVVFQNERMEAPVEMTWPELRRQVGSFAARLRAAGVVPGDRVCAYLPNTPHTVVAFLATASVGAIWSVCSPDMGPVAVLDRFRQIAPKVLVAVDGQVWGGKVHDRRPVLHEVLAGLRSVEHLVFLAEVEPAADAAAFAAPGRKAHRFADWAAGDPGAWAPLPLPFDHPLWVVYSSGTTGLPKAIVHGHGGVMLEMLKGGLHNDVGASIDTGDRFHWYSSTGRRSIALPPWNWPSTAISTLGAIWRKRSNTATGPMSGEHTDHTAPTLAQARKATTVSGMLGSQAPTRSPGCTPIATSSSASEAAWRRSSGQLHSTGAAMRSPWNTIAGCPAACAASAWRSSWRA